MKATTAKIANRILLPNKPSGAKITPNVKISAGPIDQANCEIPMFLARSVSSDVSEIYVQLAGTPAPTAIPVTINPANNIGKLTENVTISAPSKYTIIS
jgi:hypothetical protein